ncbi:DUF4760 domain-containing protein [Psychrosphaera haliotis]|uniref:DUF4760 domain-containing protein n=1 Tax=Psychrosphaera haliotis TaxID=555083 RepID=A0A6N8F988_9GAMM|nr:DUF4760 domain-containing protein [Psychrosphaera haliotis]MUH71999.1 DUF4760 domain-containing protein [Psychrosphaera haliotis]
MSEFIGGGYFFEMLNALASLMIAYGVFFFLYFSKRRERREKVEYATRFIQKWNEPAFFHITARIFNNRNIEFLHGLEPQFYEEFRVKNKEGFDDIVTILNFIEEMAQAIESNLADEYTLRKYFQQSLVDTFKILEPFVHVTREKNTT